MKYLVDRIFSRGFVFCVGKLAYTAAYFKRPLQRSRFLSGDKWVKAVGWYNAIKAQQNGVATEAQKSMLKNGHFKDS